MTDYLLKKIDNEFWKKIKKLAIDKELTVKRLIINLLKNELEKQKKE